MSNDIFLVMALGADFYDREEVVGIYATLADASVAAKQVWQRANEEYIKYGPQMTSCLEDVWVILGTMNALVPGRVGTLTFMQMEDDGTETYFINGKSDTQFFEEAEAIRIAKDRIARAEAKARREAKKLAQAKNV